MSIFPSGFKCVEWISQKPFFEISSHQACGYLQIRMVHWALAVHEPQRAPIVAVSSAVTFMASQRDAQEYLKYCKFHFNCCSGGWVKQSKTKKEFKWPNLNQSGLGVTFILEESELLLRYNTDVFGLLLAFFSKSLFSIRLTVNIKLRKRAIKKCGHFQFLKNYSVIFF